VSLDKAALLSRFDAQVRRDIAAEPGIRVERTARVVRIAGLWNCVLYSDLTADVADREILAQQMHFRRVGARFEWKVFGHDEPPDLAARLEQAGFEPAEPETFMVLDLSRGKPAAEPPRGITIRQVFDARGLADLSAVGEQAFGVDYSSLNHEFLARLPLGTVAFYVAYKGAEPVGAARLETPPGSEFAGLYGGGTAPPHRHQGIYRCLVGARAHEAARRGYRYLNVDAADASRPILERLGFVPLTTVRAWSWQPD
jgi:GNAT superfamily N-acetyltransferase